MTAVGGIAHPAAPFAPPATPPVAAARPARALVVLVVGATVSLVLLLTFTGGSIAIAFLPLAAVLAARAIWRVPPRTMLLALLATGLLAEVPSERPADGLWRSPLYPIGSLLFDNLNNVTGIDALRFSGLDLLLGLVAAVVAARSLGRRRSEGAGAGGANVLALCLAVQLAAVLWLEAYGIARGGDVRNSLWQLRPMLWLPVLAALLMHVLRGARDVRVIANVVVIAACVKSAFGLYVLYGIARPQGIDPAHVTTHSDTVLFAAAVAACLVTCVHRPTRRTLLTHGVPMLWIMLGILANNRRIAFVAVFAACWVLYAVLERGRVKRAITVGLLLAAPFGAVYLAVGRNQTGGVFGPAGKIMSVVLQRDASSGTRDIENYNLIYTLKQSPVLGSGFGHEYREVSQAHDISKVFAQYRYIGHNSVLWLWSVAGFAGFAAIWTTLVAAAFLARRAYYHARTVEQRIGASWVLTVLAIYLVQAWGDMGLHGWVVVLVLAPMLALAGQLATVTGAWPRGMRLAGVAGTASHGVRVGS